MVSPQSKNAFEKQLAFVCLDRIFSAASDSPEIYRMLSGTIVPQFIDLLPQMRIEGADPRTAQAFARCFENCLKTFKGPCSSRRKIIEDFILGLSGSANFPLLAKSFALLAFTGSNKQLATNNSFNRFMVVCVYTLDTLIDANFNEPNQLPYYSSVQEKPLLALNNVGRMEKTLDFLGKFEFLGSVAQHLLDEPFDGLVRIPVGLILNFVQRVVAFKVNQLNSTANLESILNTNIVPAMHRKALLILNQLILTCSSNLSTSLKEINKILIDLSDNFNQQDKKSYLIEIKCLWYRVVANWFNKMGNHLTVFVSKHWEELLIGGFLDDIQLKKAGLELQNAKQLQNERSTNTRFTENSNFSDDELLLCSAACETVDSFLIHFSRLMNAKRFHKFIYQLLTIVQDLYRVDLWRKSTYFVDPKLRLQLLKVFRNCLISFTNTSLLNNATTLLNTVLKLDKSSDVQLFAKETLIILNSPRNKIYYSAQDHMAATSLDSVQISNGLGDTNEEQIPANSSSGNSTSEKQQIESTSNDLTKESPKQSAESSKLPDKEDKIPKEFQKAIEISEVRPQSNDGLSIDKPATPVNESISQSTNQSANESANKSANKSFKAPSIASVSGESVASDTDGASNENVSDNRGKGRSEDDSTDDAKETEETVGNLKTLAKRAKRSRTRSATDEQPVTTRLTRSAIKKKAEEQADSNGAKRLRGESTEQSIQKQAIQKQAIDEDSEGEIQEILKDFVDD